MDIFKKNLINTTTMIDSGAGNTNASRYLIDGNTGIRFVTTGFSSTAAMINVSFSAATVVSHVILQNHNIDEIYVYYDNTTTGCVFFTCSNSSKEFFIEFPSVTANSIQVVLGRTFPINDEKRVGELIISEKRYTWDRNPSIPLYKYKTERNQIVHTLSDGGTSVYNIGENFKADIKWRFINDSMNTQFLDLFNGLEDFVFIPNPLYTCPAAWDGFAHPVYWLGDYDFKPATEDESAGYSGIMRFRGASKQR